jgi:hypothetical protein
VIERQQAAIAAREATGAPGAVVDGRDRALAALEGCRCSKGGSGPRRDLNRSGAKHTARKRGILMESWFLKSLMATVLIVPAFIAIPFLKFKYGIDPLVFLAWYFGSTAISITAYLLFMGKASELIPPWQQLLAIIFIGVFFGAVANGSLFQAVGVAPNPGLPPVIYATSSMVIFLLSAVLATTFPTLFKPATFEISHLSGIFLILLGLYFLAGGRVAIPIH